jgi:hypothetical protein
MNWICGGMRGIGWISSFPRSMGMYFILVGSFG